MDGLIKDCANRQFRRFAFIIFLMVGLSFISGYYIAAQTAETLAKESHLVNLALVGQICEALPEEEETIKQAFLQASRADITQADELVEKYALSSANYFPQGFQLYDLFRDTINSRFRFPFALFLLILGGCALYYLHCLLHEIRTATALSDKILLSRYDAETKPKSADSAALHASILLLGSRMHHLVGQLKQEKIFLHDFMQDISHQLKTPLAVLRLNHDILCSGREILPEKQAEFLEINNEQIERMSWLIHAQLKLGRLDAEVVEYHFSKTPIRYACESACAQLRPLAAEKGLSVRCEVSPSIMLLHDSEWLSEAISNLIKNAVEHTETGGITLTAEESPLSVQLTIADTGKGMTHEQMLHLFDRFSVRNHEVNSTGTGIGMAIAKKIITDNHGDINIQSKIGEGTKLVLVFLKTEKNSEKCLTNQNESDILL